MAEIVEYQKNAIDKLLECVSGTEGNVLEIGSDLDACVLDNLSGIFKGTVVGLNPDVNFPRGSSRNSEAPYNALRSDGCDLPFKDESFDAILSVATLEHVDDLDKFLRECHRVLKPGGVFYTKFSPIWSCGIGHHLCAVAGKKEARFWKPGKNPLPDFCHLVWSPDEMRAFLSSGPCDDRLIEPIISWVYDSKDISRRFLEDYIRSFRQSPLKQMVLNLIRLYPPPPDVLAQLQSKYGAEREFGCQGIEAVFQKEQSVEALNRHGEELFNNGNLKGALDVFVKVIERDSGYAQAYNNIGVLLCENGEMQNAVQYFEKALDIDPDDRDAVINCGRVMICLNQMKEAKRLYSAYLYTNPDDQEILQLLNELIDHKQNDKVGSLSHEG